MQEGLSQALLFFVVALQEPENIKLDDDKLLLRLVRLTSIGFKLKNVGKILFYPRNNVAY